MTNAEVIRSWKDPEYRAGLSNAELSEMPENPAGTLNLSDDQLRHRDRNRYTTFVDSCVRPPAGCP